MSSDKDQPISIWDIPNFPQKQIEEDVTNAMGYQSGQMAPPEVEVEPEPEPLTAKELEEIRQAAYEEGLEQGLEEGKKQGLEQGRLQGLKEGHEEGLSQGLTQGLDEGKEQIKQQVARWESLLKPLTQPLRELDHQVAEQVIALVSDLCRQLLKVELVLNERLFLQLLNEAIDTLPKGQTDLEIKLHPDDLALIESHYSSEEQEKRGWLLCSEPTLQTGVCEVNTELSSVRNDIHSRMDKLIKDFIVNNTQQEPSAELLPDFDDQDSDSLQQPIAEVHPDEQRQQNASEPEMPEPEVEAEVEAEVEPEPASIDATEEAVNPEEVRLKEPVPEEPNLDPELVSSPPEIDNEQSPS